MTIIRLPISSTDHKDEEIDTNAIKYKKYTKEFINNTFKEIKDTIGTYHSIKEIECRRKLSAFFKQKICDFELFDLFAKGVEHLPHCKTKKKNMEEMDKENAVYEEMANNIAGVFENLKQVIPPSFDVNTALQSLIDYQYLLPNLFDSKREDGDCVINFNNINRLCKIYLAKENILTYDGIKILDGIVYLSKHDLQIEIVLCGDINSPKWQLIDIKPINPINLDDKDPQNNLKHLFIHQKEEEFDNVKLRNEFIKTTKRAFTVFNFSEMAKILEIYESHCSIYKVYDKFRRAKTNCDLVIDGGYKNFTVSLDQYRIKIEISKDGRKVLCEMTSFEKTVKFSNDIIKNIEKVVGDALPDKSTFSFETGFVYFEDPKELSTNSIKISEDSKVSEFIKNLSLEELHSTSFLFRTRSMLTRFVENFIKEKFFYRKMLDGLEEYVIIRDHRSYGEHNVVVRDRKNALVISLVSQGRGTFNINLINRVELIEGVTQVFELKIDDGNLQFSPGISKIDMVTGMNFIKTHIPLLLKINRFYPYKDNFRLSKSIQIFDLEINIVANGFELESDNKMYFSSIEQVINCLSFIDLLSKLKSISQPSHPTSNLYLLKGKVIQTATEENDKSNTSSLSFDNFVSFYVQKDLEFIEFHFKDFNMSLSNTKRLETSKQIVFEVWKNTNYDLFLFLKFIDRVYPFLNFNLRPTICTTSKIFYNFSTLNDFFELKMIDNGYLINTKNKRISSKETDLNLDDIVEDVKKRYNEDRYNKIAALLSSIYKTSITGDNIECESSYLKFVIYPEMRLNISENVSRLDSTQLEVFLNSRIQLSEDFEEFTVFNDLSKINNLLQTNKNKNC